MISVNHALSLRWWLTKPWWEDTGTILQILLGTNLRWSPKPLHYRTLWKHLCWSTRTILRFASCLHVAVTTFDDFIATVFYQILLNLIHLSVCLCRIFAYQLWRRKILRPSCHKWKKCGPVRPWVWIHSRKEENWCWKGQKQQRFLPFSRIVSWCSVHCWATGQKNKQRLKCRLAGFQNYLLPFWGVLNSDLRTPLHLLKTRAVAKCFL